MHASAFKHHPVSEPGYKLEFEAGNETFGKHIKSGKLSQITNKALRTTPEQHLRKRWYKSSYVSTNCIMIDSDLNLGERTQPRNGEVLSKQNPTNITWEVTHLSQIEREEDRRRHKEFGLRVKWVNCNPSHVSLNPIYHFWITPLHPVGSCISLKYVSRLPRALW